MNKALNYALYLFKFRPRSEYELSQRLQERGISKRAISQVVISLRKNGLINDFEFAKAWVESRIKKPLGFRRLRQELKLKGVKNEIISQVFSLFNDRYSEEEVIKGVVSRRQELLRNIPPEKAKQRIFLYLMRRGFSAGQIREVISQCFKADKKSAYF
ncbi:MAG: regulatory protein RecX [Candidatus Omnitrophota bacterium]